eukprot:65746-Chlamydomonas_euryale.AAC.5
MPHAALSSRPGLRALASSCLRTRHTRARVCLCVETTCVIVRGTAALALRMRDHACVFLCVWKVAWPHWLRTDFHLASCHD